MKFLLLNAGAKNNGATQEILLTIKTEISNGEITDIFCLGDLNINYCKGCMKCYNTCVCVQNDDMNILIDAIDSSDIIVIASPSYWADVPGQFKVFIDRCTVYSETNPNPNHRTLKSGKKCYAIALRRGKRTSECEHIIDSINHWCGHMKIEMVDSMYFCEIGNKDDVTRHKETICKKTDEWFGELI
ncbi:MAG: flavodoxin family protein [Oscillospiraceae bacterium]